MSDIQFTLLLLAVVVVLFITERLPMELVAIGIMVTLAFRGVLSVEKSVAGFANPALLTVACMFAVSQGITSTGAVGYLGRKLIQLAGGAERRLIALSTGVVASVSGLVNNTPVVAVFVPLMLGISRTTGIAPSRLLIPISFASIVGGTVTLLGTSTNLLVRDVVQTIAEDEGASAELEISIFDFAPIGIVLSIVGVAYLVLVGHRLLPNRQGVTTAGQAHEYMTEVILPAGSRLLQSPFQASMLGDEKLRLIQVIRGDRILWPPFDSMQLQAQDVLLIKGPPQTILSFLHAQKVDLAPELKESADDSVLLKTVDTTLAEVVLTPGSRYIGRTISDIGFRRHHQVSVVGIQRRGSHLRGEISGTPLRLGDVLLVHGASSAIQLLRGEDDFLLVEGVQDAVEDRRKAPIAVALSAAVVVGAYVDVGLLLPCAMTAVALMVLTQCLSLRQVFRSIDWSIIVLIAGMLAMGRAMSETGAAREVALAITGGVQQLGLPEAVVPWVLVSAIYLITAVMTEFVSNNATAVLMTSIAYSTAIGLDVSPRPFIFAVAYAASLSFCTPVGYQTNTFVYGPGNYKFSDFFRVGFPLSFICWLLCSILVPLVFPF